MTAAGQVMKMKNGSKIEKKELLTGKITTGTVRVTAISTARRTIRSRTSGPRYAEYVWSSSGSTFPI